MNFRFLALPLAFVLALSACRTALIYNVQNTPVNVYKENYTITDVEKSILRGGIGLGWKMQVVKPGLIRAVLNLRSHTAVVTIPYTLKEYSILYESSVNLDYYNGEIHSNYNSWVQNLDRAIQKELLL